MKALLFKEIKSFYSSLLGYIVIAVFLAANGVLLWILPDANVFDYGYASIDIFFVNAPYLFLLLIPAITMRSFAEEKKSGTIELLLTRPLTETQIILAKFFASLTLVILSLLPTLIYVVSLYNLTNPVGNVDLGSIWGSYLGLLFLASVYVAIGLFASSITDNQIISFITAISICVFATFGLNELSKVNTLEIFDLLIQNLGLLAHYNSMSRGVLDSRDAIYFISASAVFILMTRLVLQSRKW
jgi:ABC-2 type transport system permease protein